MHTSTANNDNPYAAEQHQLQNASWPSADSLQELQDNAGEQCLHFIVQSPDPSNSPWSIALFTTLYAHIFVLGLLGNLAVVLLTLRCRHLRSVQNIFILNLAISDVIVCLLSLPFTPVAYIYKEWLFGSAICHLLPMVQAASVFVSTFSLSAIAIDRFWLVHYPHAGSLSMRQATVVAAILWAMSVLISVPYSVHMTLEEYPGYCGKFCTERWSSMQIRRTYSISVLVLQFVVPFLTMSFCYACIFSRLRRRAHTKLAKLNERQRMLAKQCNGNGAAVTDGSLAEKCRSADDLCARVPVSRADSGNDRVRVNALSKQQRRTTGILVTVVLFFFFAWLPHNVREMVIEYDEQLLTNRAGTNYTYLLSMITHSVAMTTNVANPILYAWLNPTFKEVFLRTIRRGGGSASGRASPWNVAGQTQQQQNGGSGKTQTSSSLADGRLLVQLNDACCEKGPSAKRDFF